jgi:hypothetical protein
MHFDRRLIPAGPPGDDQILDRHPTPPRYISAMKVQENP